MEFPRIKTKNSSNSIREIANDRTQLKTGVIKLRQGIVSKVIGKSVAYTKEIPAIALQEISLRDKGFCSLIKS